MLRPVADQQVLRGKAATLTVTWFGGDGEPVAAPSPVTVTVARSDGTTVTTGAAGSSGNTSTFGLTAAETVQLDLFTATWTATGASQTTTVEIVGGYFFTATEARAGDSAMSDTAKYPDARLLARRAQVEAEIEMAADVAFVPRFSVVQIEGNGTNEIVGPAMPRALRWAMINYGAATRDLTVSEIAGLRMERSGEISLLAGSWPEHALVTIGVEHGHDRPPHKIRDAAITLLRVRMNTGTSNFPDRAERYQAVEGGTMYLSMPGAYKIGIPEVDAAIATYGVRVPAVA
jgi:hypothetical protein